MTNPALEVRVVTNALAQVAATLASVAGLASDELLDLQSAVGEHGRVLARLSTLAAGEIARRSHRDLGYSGLAQSTGFRTAEDLIQSVTGSTRAEATKLVRVGAIMQSSEGWYAPLVSAVTAGVLSVDGVESIRRGLGEPDAAITPAHLTAAVEQLVRSAAGSTADVLYRRARELRDELDEESIARREKERRDLRYFTTRRRGDGMISGSFLLDQEDGGLLVSAIDTMLSPRRGGPSFIDPAAKRDAAALIADPRSNPQLAADAFMSMVRLAVDADPGTLFGRRRPAVRVIVTEQSLTTGVGYGTIEGQPDPVSLATVDRHLCDTGIIGVKFDTNGTCVDIGRDQRLFTERQRIAMSVRDGGCLVPGCTRPPAHCEAHHINHWGRDRGKTDLADGVLLCRHHHLLMHNNGWEIVRRAHEYWLTPPSTVDPELRPVQLHTKSRAMRERKRELERVG